MLLGQPAAIGDAIPGIDQRREEMDDFRADPGEL
jgi:hypothetical protein